MARLAAGSWNGNVMSAFSSNRRRILSLWLPRLPIDRIKRGLVASAELDKTPRVVVAKQNNALQIHALDEIASRAGLAVGLPLANARAICPELVVFDADVVADARPLGAIADWCDRLPHWWRSIRRMACIWTLPVAPICSAANARCCRSFMAR